jgi:hypothetical protein
MIAFSMEPAGPVQSLERSARQYAPASTADDFVTMPTDLRSWFCVPTILAWIEQEVLQISGASNAANARKNVSGMLRVLTFAYATQVFASEEIAKECRGNQVFQWLCCGSTPFSQELRSFRRKNRLLLEKILSGLFMRAILHRFGLVAASVPEELRVDLSEHARERLNIARHLDAGDE